MDLSELEKAVDESIKLEVMTKHVEEEIKLRKIEMEKVLNELITQQSKEELCIKMEI